MKTGFGNEANDIISAYNEKFYKNASLNTIHTIIVE